MNNWERREEGVKISTLKAPGTLEVNIIFGEVAERVHGYSEADVRVYVCEPNAEQVFRIGNALLLQHLIWRSLSRSIYIAPTMRKCHAHDNGAKKNGDGIFDPATAIKLSRRREAPRDILLHQRY